MTNPTSLKPMQPTGDSRRIATSANRHPVRWFSALALVGTMCLFGCTASTDSPEVMLEKARMFAERGQHEEAIPAYTTALQAFPDRADVFYLRGVSHEKLELPEKALEDYSACLELNPSYSKAINDKGVVLAKLERFDEAIQQFTLLVNEFPDDALARRNRALCLHDLAKFDEAILDYNKAIELAPKVAEAWFQLGNVFLEQNKFSEAVINYDKAISLNGEFAKAWMERGVAKYKLGQKAEALADLQQAHSIDRNIVIPGIDWAEVASAADVVVMAKPVMPENVQFDWIGCLAFAKQVLVEKGFSELTETTAFPEQRCGILQGLIDGQNRQIYIGFRPNEGSNIAALPAIPPTEPAAQLSLLILETVETLDGPSSTELHVHSFQQDWNASGEDVKPLLISVELPNK